MGESTLEVFNKSLISETLPISFVFEYKLWASVLLAGNWGPNSAHQIHSGEHKHTLTNSVPRLRLPQGSNLMGMSGDPLIPKKSTKKKNTYICLYVHKADWTCN